MLPDLPAHVKHAPGAVTLELKAMPNLRLVSYHTAVTEKAPFKTLGTINFLPFGIPI